MKKILLSTLIAAASFVTLAGQAHAGTTLDAVKKKDLFNAVSATACQASLTLTPKANSPVSTLTSAVRWLLPCLVMLRK
jgi:hypothetical protein